MMKNRNQRLALFAGLYFAQGTMLSYFLTFNILYLGASGYSAADIGIFQGVLVLPFILKIFLGMLSDGVNLFGFGHRKPYIILGLIGQAAAIIAAANVSVEHGLGAFAMLAFIASVSMALYDTCTDGLALDTTPEEESGMIQGIMTGAKAAGILTTLLVGGFIAQTFGWRWVFYIIGIFALLPLLLVVQIKEDPQRVQRQKFQWSAFKAFGRGAVLLLGLLGLIYSIALEGILTFLSDYLRGAMEVSIGNIGILVAISMLGRIVGALTNSRVTDKIGHKQSLFVAIALTSIASLGLAFRGGLVLIGLFGFVFGLAYGYYTSVYAAVAMDMSDRRIAASMFAIFMMFLNLGIVGGQVFGGILTENFGFNMMALGMGVFNLLNIFLVSKLFKTR